MQLMTLLNYDKNVWPHQWEGTYFLDSEKSYITLKTYTYCLAGKQHTIIF